MLKTVRLRERRRDWPKIIEEIAWCLGESDLAFPQIRKPASTYAVAADLGISRGQLRYILDGTRPKYEEGCDILRRWSELTGKAEGFAPVEAMTSLSAARMKG